MVNKAACQANHYLCPIHQEAMQGSRDDMEMDGDELAKHLAALNNAGKTVHY